MNTNGQRKYFSILVPRFRWYHHLFASRGAHWMPHTFPSKSRRASAFMPAASHFLVSAMISSLVIGLPQPASKTAARRTSLIGSPQQAALNGPRDSYQPGTHKDRIQRQHETKPEQDRMLSALTVHPSTNHLLASGCGSTAKPVSHFGVHPGLDSLCKFVVSPFPKIVSKLFVLLLD